MAKVGNAFFEWQGFELYWGIRQNRGQLTQGPIHFSEMRPNSNIADNVHIKYKHNN